jgi:hypothetical protein
VGETSAGHVLLWEVFSDASIGADGWIEHDDSHLTLEQFQAVVRAAEEWESIGLIEIVVKREETGSGYSLIDAIRFRRLK